MQNDVDIVLPDSISEYNTVINETISEKEVTCGGDKILNEFLKHAADKLMPVFVKISNIIFESGIAPDSWYEGYSITGQVVRW